MFQVPSSVATYSSPPSASPLPPLPAKKVLAIKQAIDLYQVNRRLIILSPPPLSVAPQAKTLPEAYLVGIVLGTDFAVPPNTLPPKSSLRRDLPDRSSITNLSGGSVSLRPSPEQTMISHPMGPDSLLLKESLPKAVYPPLA